MNLKSKSQYFCIVVNEKTPNELEVLQERLYDCAIYNFYASIIHDKDTLSNGNLKTKHLHLFCEKPSKIALETALNEFCNYFDLNKEQVSIEGTNNNFLYVQYLTHKNDQSKHQYDLKDIKTNNEAELLARYSNTYKTPPTEAEIIYHLKNDTTLGELIENIGLDNSKKYKVLFDGFRKDHTEKMTNLDLKSRVLELEDCIKELYEVIYSHYGFTVVEEAENILKKYDILK